MRTARQRLLAVALLLACRGASPSAERSAPAAPDATVATEVGPDGELIPIDGPPGPPPPPAEPVRNDALEEAAFATDVNTYLATENVSGYGEGLYTTVPVLARTGHVTPYLDRDRQRVTTGINLQDGDTQLREGSATIQIAGSLREKENVIYMTRHGLYRRSDSKFDEFIAQPTRSTGNDGYGMWRVWESHGPCPRELLLADPWGSIAWEASEGPLHTFECSWVVRPGMYRQEGYFKLSLAPIVINFRTFSLASPHEKLTVYDGAQADAEVLASFSGPRRPEQITSTTAEVRIVLQADLPANSTDIWTELDEAITRGDLRAAQHSFIFAARAHLIGFYQQPMRRIIRALALRLCRSRPENAWMRRAWFSGSGEVGWQRAYNDSLASVLQDLTSWEKRSRHEEGKEDMPWDNRFGTRRYPINMLEPESNPFHPGIAVGATSPSFDQVDVEESTQLQRALGFLPSRPSGFSLDFTTSADCYGAGIAPYGTGYGSAYGVFPPLTMSSNPSKNFEFLPFPLQATSCQPAIISGPQLTRDRPFTVADSVMKTQQELELSQCVGDSPDRTNCPVQINDGSELAQNCSAPCGVFMQCVHDGMSNRSLWQSGRHGSFMYNKSHAATWRERCLALPEAEYCTRVQFPEVDERGLPATPPWPWTREMPKHGTCLQYKCVTCAITIFASYFNCALQCSLAGEASATCIDCSYSFQDSYEDVDYLRDRIWEGYLSGMFGFHQCPDCVLDSPSMMGGPEMPMTPECRRCHYALEDFINNDVFQCFDQATPDEFGAITGTSAATRCFTQSRGGYNYEQDFFSILKPELRGSLVLTISGTETDDDGKGKGGGYNYGQ